MYFNSLLNDNEKCGRCSIHVVPSLKMLLTAWLAFGLSDSRTSQANLIVNGSFETPLVTPGSFQNFGGGSTAISGWTVVGVDSSVVSGTFAQSGVVFNAQDGVQWLDLAGVTSNNPNSGVRQTIATTVGQSYRISFYVGSAQSSPFFFPTTVDLSIDGGTRQSFFNPHSPPNNLDWMNFTVDFVANNFLTDLTFLNGSAPNNFLTALDNVSVTPVPEPSSALSGLIAMGLFALRRR